LTHTPYWPPDLAWTKVQVPDFMDAVREAMRRGEVDLRQARVEDRDWPRYAQTMVGMYRLDNVQEAVETVIADGVPADLIEAEVCPVGSTILVRAVLDVYGVDDRAVSSPTRSAAFAAQRGGVPGRCWRRPPQPRAPRRVAAADVERNFHMLEVPALSCVCSVG
jgi:Macrocin-O-methyltransferase (TylF)